MIVPRRRPWRTAAPSTATLAGSITAANPSSFDTLSSAGSRRGVPTSRLRSRSTAGVNGCTSDAQRIQPGSSATGKYTPASSVRPVTTSVAPTLVCLNITTADAIRTPNGANATAARNATATPAGRVGQRSGSPNRTPAYTTDAAASASESSSGKIISDRTQRTAPNGDSTIRSNVPASSSDRSVATGATSVEVMTSRMITPTTTNA